MASNKLQVEEIVDRALAEDLNKGDVTTEALIQGNRQGRGFLVAKEDGVLAGMDVAKQVFHRVDPELKVEVLLQDGARVTPGTVIANVWGSIAGILKAERVALNFLQRLSGIASETNRYVEAVRSLPVRIMDTRKTTPGLRLLEKHAVRAGGGENHRMTLGDGILIKDNHLATLRSQGLNIKEIVAGARGGSPQRLPVEVEVGTVVEAREAVEAGADTVMLDNMSLEDMREAVKSIGGRALVEASGGITLDNVRAVAEALEAVEAGAETVMLDNMSLEDMREAVKSIGGRALAEASGGITLDNVRAVAETGVDFISVGALTHSVSALDISLELEAQ